MLGRNSGGGEAEQYRLQYLNGCGELMLGKGNHIVGQKQIDQK